MMRTLVGDLRVVTPSLFTLVLFSLPLLAGESYRQDGTRRSDDPGEYRAYFRAHGGDAARGRQLFLGRADLSCASCHGEPGRGGGVGPDLAGIGGRRDSEYLMDAILDPSKDVAPGFGTATIVLKDGTALRGTYLGQSPEAVIIRKEGSRRVVRKADIERWQILSDMPRGLERQMTLQEFSDLIAFLNSLH
jgi:putative heme-binding domain-containing protein